MVSLNLCPAPVFPWIFLKFQLKQLKVLLEKATFEILKKSIKKKKSIWSHLLKKSLMENFIFSAMGAKRPPP